jgi:GGDEF domain-containing protein
MSQLVVTPSFDIVLGPGYLAGAPPTPSPRVASPIALQFSTDDHAPPETVAGWLRGRCMSVLPVRAEDDLMTLALRGRPRLVLFDARAQPGRVLDACRRLKADSYTGVVPCVVVTTDDEEAFRGAFEAGADEVIRERLDANEVETRLDAMLRRSDRDLVVHPSTRLPGAVEIESEVARRLAGGERFAMCYADLDHFKEYNDRYSYYEGDRVIRMLAKILHDVVKGLAREQGFVGHIGGDDFIFVIPDEYVAEVCTEIVDVFDLLVPFQYSEQDRRAGYFFGKDRRGQLHRVPLMTVSIGVVTNERRTFTHAAQVSELATEMKSYAKTLPGSVYAIDRRQDSNAAEPGQPSRRADPKGAREGK